MREKIRIPLARNRFAIVLASLLVLGAFAIAPALVSANAPAATSPIVACKTAAEKTTPAQQADATKAENLKSADQAATMKTAQRGTVKWFVEELFILPSAAKPAANQAATMKKANQAATLNAQTPVANFFENLFGQQTAAKPAANQAATMRNAYYPGSTSISKLMPAQKLVMPAQELA